MPETVDDFDTLNAPGRDVPRRTIVVLVGLAAALRLAYFFEYARLPFLDGPLYDSLVYLVQAHAVREGVFDHPALLAFSPLYGWFLAALGGCGGMTLAAALQLVLGCVNVYLLLAVSCRLFGRRAAVAAALLYTGYGVPLFFESKIMAETLGTTLLLLALRLYLSGAFSRGGRYAALSCGAALGLSTLARANLLLALPFFVLLALLPWGRFFEESAGGRVRARRTAWLLAGTALVLGANGLWNAAHTGRFVPVIMASGSVDRATAGEWNGSLAPLSADGSGEVSPFDVVREAKRKLEGPGGTMHAPPIDAAGWLRNMPRKLAATLSDYETSYQYGYYGERSEILSLRITPVSFGLLLVLGAVGAVLLVSRRGAASIVPFLPLAAGVLATTTLYHPSSRYRLAAALPLILLASVPFARIAAVRGRRRLALAAALTAAAVVFFASRQWTYTLRRPGMWHLKAAEAALVSGNVEEARRRVRLAREVQPDDPEIHERIEELERLPGGL